MKPNKAQQQRLHVYFKKVLGYGNKCVDCNKQAEIKMTTKNDVNFRCLKCKKTWAFSSNITVEKMFLKTFGI